MIHSTKRFTQRSKQLSSAKIDFPDAWGVEQCSEESLWWTERPYLVFARGLPDSTSPLVRQPLASNDVCSASASNSVKMVYGCWNKTIKFLVFAVNFFICLAGGGRMGVGSFANTDQSFTSKLQKIMQDNNVTDVNLSQFKLAIWVLVGVGAVLFVTG